MNVQEFFDPITNTLTYLIFIKETKQAIVIDPVLDFDYSSGRYSYESIDKLCSFLSSQDLSLVAALETHAHADHLSGCGILKMKFPKLKVGIGKEIVKVQMAFKKIYNINQLPTDGSQFDILFNNSEVIELAGLSIKILNVPGHTPACVAYCIEDYVFVGDSIFMPDFGTGRCDFPGGDAPTLFRSIKDVLYQLPGESKICVGHDYMPSGRELRWQTTVKEQKISNIHIKEDTSLEDFVEFRNSRDENLKAPRLLLPSLQVNIQAGKLPDPESNNISYLKIPIIQG